LIEEPFEIAGDEVEVGAPRKARIQRQKNPKFELFHGIRFLIANDTFNSSPTAYEIAKVIQHGGGKIVNLENQNEEEEQIDENEEIYKISRKPNRKELNRNHLSEIQLFRFISAFSNHYFKRDILERK